MNIIIETKHLILREYTHNDIEALLSILSDPITMQFWPTPFDRKGTEKWIEFTLESYREFDFGRYAVILKSTGEMIGDCGFKRVMINGVLENDLGYIIDKKYWGQGFATEASKACLQYGIDKHGMKRIVANMAVDHLASKKVAEKIGFKLEREFINSRNRDLPTFILSFEIDSNKK